MFEVDKGTEKKVTSRSLYQRHIQCQLLRQWITLDSSVTISAPLMANLDGRSLFRSTLSIIVIHFHRSLISTTKPTELDIVQFDYGQKMICGHFCMWSKISSLRIQKLIFAFFCVLSFDVITWNSCRGILNSSLK